MILNGNCSLGFHVILKLSNIVKFHVNKYNLLTPQDLYSISSCPISMTTQQVTKKFQRIIYPQPNIELFNAMSRHYSWDTYRVKISCIDFCSSLEILKSYLLKYMQQKLCRKNQKGLEKKVFVHFNSNILFFNSHKYVNKYHGSRIILVI